MRIISYNILDGGVGRADPLAEVIEAQRPDVVGLVEADDLAVVERIANRLKMDYVHAIGNSHAVALLARDPILESVNYAPLEPRLSKCFLDAKVQTSRGEIVLAIIHLHDGAFEQDEDRREEEVGIILDRLKHYRDDRLPHMIMGDFNSTSPLQEIDPQKLCPTSKQAFADNGNIIPRRVIQRILDTGYGDCLAMARRMEAKIGATFTTLHPGQRIDCIFVNGMEAGAVKDAWIETDRLARYASDHFPIGAEIE